MDGSIKTAKKQNAAKEVLRRKVIYAGKKIFSEGDAGDEAFIIESGDVEIYRTEHGKEIQLGIVGKGSLIGEMALIDDQPRMATARAVNQAVVIAIGPDAFAKKVAQADPFIRKMLTIMVRYTRLHAEYFAKAQSNLQETYQVLGLDAEQPDFDRLKEMMWQIEQAEEIIHEKAEKKAKAAQAQRASQKKWWHV